LAGVDEDEIRLPTAGLARLAFDVDAWSAVRPGGGRLEGIATPRSLDEGSDR
jgi:hypothetical protein